MGDLREEFRVGYDEAEVYVHWGSYAGFQLEIAEFNGRNVVELKD